MTSANKRQIGLLGGSFDPPHEGHLWMARRAKALLDLDEIWLLPAWSPPHKNTSEQSSFDHRLAMTELLAAESEFIRVDPVERELGGTSYTIDTVRHLKQEHGRQCEFQLIIGGDSLADLDQWRQPEKLCRELPVAVLVRAGHASETTLPCRIFDGETHPAQSREIRSAIGGNGNVRWLTARVAAYIKTHALYQSRAEGETS
ncbi:MAG: nicotinate (nicotinamide) nucleotide adenylyltransferase [bacterium]|nr:nicotinate (nicotinamide) nucleotide adenylyltransferase [bacterium]